MTIQSVLLTDPVTVPDTGTVDQAIELLFKHRIKALPVVNAQGRYRGLFSIDSLLRALLPRAALLDEGAALPDLTFVRDSLDVLRSRLNEHLQEPALKFSDTGFKPLTLDESLTEALLQLHRHHHALPVTDPATGRLVGVVTAWALLERLTGRRS